MRGGFSKRANLREKKYLPRAENKLSSLGYLAKSTVLKEGSIQEWFLLLNISSPNIGSISELQQRKLCKSPLFS